MEQPLEVGYPHFIISCSFFNQETVFIDLINGITSPVK
jgi:hypothetical protein